MFTHSSETVQGNHEAEDQRGGGGEEHFPGFMAFTDCTEQPIPRPTKNNRKKGKLYYSGKKKKHTVKNLYTSNQKKGLIIYKTKHRQRGRKHDYRIFKKNHPKLSEDIMSICMILGF